MKKRRGRFARVRPVKTGFTLMEVLIIIAIVIILLIFVLINLRKQLSKAHDAQRKTDLQKIVKVFEEYFNDKQCYPVETILESCGADTLNPYLRSVPCDPVLKTPYIYVPGAPTLCSGFRICTKLESTNDPDIIRMGCDPISGCGWYPGYNYCLSTGLDVVRTADNAGTAGDIGGPTPTISPTPTPYFGGVWACRRNGGCDNVGNPPPVGCPQSFPDDTCGGNDCTTNTWLQCPL